VRGAVSIWEDAVIYTKILRNGRATRTYPVVFTVATYHAYIQRAFVRHVFTPCLKIENVVTWNTISHTPETSRRSLLRTCTRVRILSHGASLRRGFILICVISTQPNAHKKGFFSVGGRPRRARLNNNNNNNNNNRGTIKPTPLISRRRRYYIVLHRPATTIAAGVRGDASFPPPTPPHPDAKRIWNIGISLVPETLMIMLDAVSNFYQRKFNTRVVVVNRRYVRASSADILIFATNAVDEVRR